MGVKDTANLALIPAAYKASKVYSAIPTDGDGDFTFTRTGSGTRINKAGLIETVGSNVPRLNYRLDADGNPSSCPELLLEPQRTNTHTYSESASGKTTNNVTLTNNQAISPMGTNTAIKVTEDTTFNRHRFYADNNSVTSGTTYTISFFVKKNSDNRYVYLNAGALLGASGSFDLDTGSVTGNMQVFEVYPNGWYRIGITKTATSSTTNIYFVQMQQGTTDVSYTGDGSSFYFWGQQFEVGSNPSSYIPVPSTGNVTRNKDQAYKANFADLASDYPITVYWKGRITDHSTGQYIFSIINDGSAVEYLGIEIANTGYIYLQRRSSNNDADQITYSTQVGDVKKIAVKFTSSTTAVVYIDGVEVYNLSSGAVVAWSFDSVLVGQHRIVVDQNDRNPADEFFIWNKALTDEEMIEITTP